MESIDQPGLANVIPRINGAVITSYIGKTVRIVCSVVSNSKNTLDVLTSDKHPLHVTKVPVAEFVMAPGSIVEILGQVIDPENIQEKSRTLFSNTMDLELYDRAVQLIHKNRKLFGIK